ncbi:hypothetical protein EXIGLDRAFT_432140 [Exidia glandulosa HHB12029]|uniref:Uncharacterized protein n=1 Tax=Exidia glandulosa HHB12029 TaxID=1314781 RepID=A0A165KHI9_EXIGL|nr:hypothetical protein EXIGLDRAFT_432140 [Exidia glandulosa HHB12029]
MALSCPMPLCAWQSSLAESRYLIRHLRIVHRPDLVGLDENALLARSILATHEDARKLVSQLSEPVPTCSQCWAEFSRSDALRRHITDNRCPVAAFLSNTAPTSSDFDLERVSQLSPRSPVQEPPVSHFTSSSSATNAAPATIGVCTPPSSSLATLPPWSATTPTAPEVAYMGSPYGDDLDRLFWYLVTDPNAWRV